MNSEVIWSRERNPVWINSSAGSFWFKTVAGSESGITRYWLHKRLRELYGWRAYRMCRDGIIYKTPGKYPLGEWGVNG